MLIYTYLVHTFLSLKDEKENDKNLFTTTSTQYLSFEMREFFSRKLCRDGGYFTKLSPGTLSGSTSLCWEVELFQRL